MKKNKVLFIMNLPPPIHGASMMGQFIKEGQLMNSTFSSKYINLGLSKKVDDIGRRSLYKVFNFIKIHVLTILNLIFFNPKIVYITLSSSGPGFYKDFMLIFLVKLFQKKIIFHFHNKGISKRQKYRLDNFLYTTVFKQSSVILLSKYLYYDIKKYVRPENVYFCANGVPHSKIDVINRSIKKKTEILFLSNLIESKGVYILLEACKILASSGIDFKCTFIGGLGDISEEKFNKKVSELKISDKIDFLGKKFDKEKEQAFCKADIFALPTFYKNECFPLVILEAMQYSLPIVSTMEGAIPEIVTNKNGFIVKKNDATDLYEKLKILIQNPELRIKLGHNGYAMYKTKYTIHAFEQNMVQILSSIINS